MSTSVIANYDVTFKGIGTRREKTDCGLQKPSLILGFACSNLSKKIIKRLLAVYPQVRMVRMIDVKQKISKGTAFWVDSVTVFHMSEIQ